MARAGGPARTVVTSPPPGAPGNAPTGGIRPTLGNPALRRLVAAFGALNLSEFAFMTALTIVAFRDGGTVAVAFVGFRLFPGALSSVLLAPRLIGRHGVLGRIGLARSGLLALAAAGTLAGAPMAVILVLVSLDAIAAAPYRPAQTRLLPRLADAPAEIAAAAATLSLTKTLAQAAGALVGGLVAALTDPRAALAGAAVLMLAAAALASQPAGLRLRLGGAGAVSSAGLRDLAAVLTDGQAAPFVLASGLRNLVRGAWSALLVVVALQLFGLGRSGVGLFNAAAAIGTAVALPLTARLIGRERLAPASAAAFAAAGVLFALIGTSSVAGLAVVIVCGWGVAMAVADATTISLLARLLDATALSRTVNATEALKLALEGLGALLAPALVTLFGIRSSLLLAGLPLPVVVGLTLPRMHRADRAAAHRGALVSLLHRADVLHRLDMSALEIVAAGAHARDYPAGAEIIRQGEPGAHFFVIGRGEADVLIDGYPVGRLGPGAGFGERALLRGTRRAATVRAHGAIEVWAIDAATFMQAAAGPDAVDAPALNGAADASGPVSVSEALARVTPLRGLARAQLQRLEARASTRSWAPGETVVRQGDVADALYLILAGRAITTIDEEPVSELVAGDWFGELAILNSVPRTASVSAVERLTTAAIPAEAFAAALRGA